MVKIPGISVNFYKTIRKTSITNVEHTFGIHTCIYIGAHIYMYTQTLQVRCVQRRVFTWSRHLFVRTRARMAMRTRMTTRAHVRTSLTHTRSHRSTHARARKRALSQTTQTTQTTLSSLKPPRAQDELRGCSNQRVGLPPATHVASPCLCETHGWFRGVRTCVRVVCALILGY